MPRRVMMHVCKPQAVRPKLSQEQHAQLKLCFQLMDEDGSGNIDGSELSNAFKVS